MKQTVLQAFQQRTRVVGLVLFMWTSTIPVGGILAKSHRVRARPVISVGVFNYAGVTRLKLRVAERQASTVMSEADVRITWTEYSRKAPSTPSQSENLAPDFCIRIIDASKINRSEWFLGPDALGESLIPSGSATPLAGGIAYVFYDRVKDFSSLSSHYPGQILGEAIAHELGHLLLGPRHSLHGIMKARWTPQDLEKIKRYQLKFSSAEVRLLQRAARSIQRNHPISLAARR